MAFSAVGRAEAQPEGSLKKQSTKLDTHLFRTLRALLLLSINLCAKVHWEARIPTASNQPGHDVDMSLVP